MSVTWRNDNLRIRWRTNYLGSFKASQSLEEDYQEYIAENDARCEAGEDTVSVTQKNLPTKIMARS